MKYFEDAKYLWKTSVPKSGQADTVQGELMRAVEKLRWEAQNNGNGNWDDENGHINEDFVRFCDFLEETLAVTPPFEKDSLQEIRNDITRLRDFVRPYLEDDIYERLEDRIVELHRFFGKPIKRELDPLQRH